MNLVTHTTTHTSKVNTGFLSILCACAGEEEEEGYPDEYQLEDLDIGAGDYVKQEGVSDFRSTWEEIGEESEMADSYGLGQRDSLQEAVEAVIAILGMQVSRPTCLPGLLLAWCKL